MKKLLASVITLLLLVSCCLIAAFPTSATDINYDDFDIIDGVLLEYVGPGGDVVVPAVDEDGNPVTRIDTKAFRDFKPCFFKGIFRHWKKRNRMCQPVL